MATRHIAVQEVPLETVAGPMRRPTPWAHDFSDLSYEWRRITIEVVGTFLLVLAAAGAPVVGTLYPGMVSRDAAVVAPALTVMAVILAAGGVSGAHLNPAVTVAFSLRNEFPWRRVPLYVVAQVGGAIAAVLVLWVDLREGGQAWQRSATST